MRPEQFPPTRKWVSTLLFASLIIASLITAPIVNAQSEGPQLLTFIPTPTPTLATTIEPSDIPDSRQPVNQMVVPTQEPEGVIRFDGQFDPAWMIEYEVAVPDEELKSLGSIERAGAQVEDMLASKGLSEKGITYQVYPIDGDRYKVALQGRNTLEVLRAVIFADLQPELDLLNGAVDLTITAPVTPGQEIPLVLESRPATGFLWELDPAATTGVAQSGETQTLAKVEQAGAPATETLLLRATQDGTANIHLLYRRPWESDTAISRWVSLSLVEAPESLDLSNPAAVIQSSPPELELPRVSEEPTVGLPSAFDWHSQGKTPPVRNQGSCGSCWSFGTVGAMESAMMVQAGLSAPNLSEQFLISCNTDNYGCNGGWWAHDYHVSKLGRNQTSAGSVLESDKPYTATDGTCSVNYAKASKLGSWGYVNGSYNSIPSVDQIKNAIYNYGSVAAAVCAGNAWGSYGGGVFSTEEKSQCTGTGQVNHAITLVGWDDSNQTWLLRNSWGSSWGDGGYMHIKWGTSNVGYGATYVIYAGSAPSPTATPTRTPTNTATPTKTATPTTPPPAPASNDSITSAKVIAHQGGAVTYTDQVNTAGAGTAIDDPYFPSKPASQFNNTVWYQFTPVSTGSLAIKTTGSSYDTVLGVWTGQPGALNLVKWNNNASGRKTSSLTFTTGKGVTYYIEVAAKGTGGTLAFSLKYSPSVLTNNSVSYATRIKYAASPAQSTYNNVLDVARSTTASSDPVFPGNYGKGYRTTWFRFTPKVNGSLSVSTSGSNYSNLIGIWTKSGTKYTLIGWTSNGSGQVQLTGGKTYFIEVASINATGPSKLNFWMNFAPGS